jgi:hypothetical protein
VARWAAFAVDLFNPVDDVVGITDLLDDSIDELRATSAMVPKLQDYRHTAAEWIIAVEEARQEFGGNYGLDPGIGLADLEKLLRPGESKKDLILRIWRNPAAVKEELQRVSGGQ